MKVKSMQTIHMGNYLGLLRKIFHNGFTQKTSQGESVGLLGEQLMFKDVGLRFPMLTARKLYWKNVAGELDWMLSGSTNIKDLHEHCDSHIWDAWADEDGNIGPVYGEQLRRWNAGGFYAADFDTFRANILDQAVHWLEDLIKVPWSRRHVLSLWNVADLSPKQMPSCIITIQACLTPIPPGQHPIERFGGHRAALNLLVTLRSSDAMLGLPQDIACYALFLKYLADYLGYWPGSLYMTLNNVHIYKDHFEQYQKLMSQAQYLPPIEKGTPQVFCMVGEDHIQRRSTKEFFDRANTFGSYNVDNYEPQPFIKMR